MWHVHDLYLVASTVHSMWHVHGEMMPHINYFIYEGVGLITTTLLKTRVRNCLLHLLSA